jgi:hypothetical protein
MNVVYEFMCRVRTQNGAVLGTRASNEARPKFPKDPFKVITEPEGLVELFFCKRMAVIHLKEERAPYL